MSCRAVLISSRISHSDSMVMLRIKTSSIEQEEGMDKGRATKDKRKGKENGKGTEERNNRGKAKKLGLVTM
jgi:hypothetical protein